MHVTVCHLYTDRKHKTVLQRKKKCTKYVSDTFSYLENPPGVITWWNGRMLKI